MPTALRSAREDSILDSYWPVKTPGSAPGVDTPGKRIVAYYGNLLSKKMGVLGEYEPEEMLRKLDVEVAAWTKADPTTPVPAGAALIAVVAQGAPEQRRAGIGCAMDSALIERVFFLPRSPPSGMRSLFLDVQVGLSNLRDEPGPRLSGFLDARIFTFRDRPRVLDERWNAAARRSGPTTRPT